MKLKWCKNFSQARWRWGYLVLDFLFGAIFISILYLSWGLSVTHFPFVLFASTLTREISIKNGKRAPSCACGLILGLFGCSVLMEQRLIEGIVEKKYEIKSPAWSGITTEGQTGP